MTRPQAGASRRYAVVAGGGTGGHLQPALAVSRALVERGHPVGSIEMVGSRRGQEGAGPVGEFPVTLLPGRGLRRRSDLRSTASNLAALAGLVLAALRMVVLLARWRPRVVVSVGGYASLPAGLVALVLRIPLVLVNVDAVPGLVHRLLGRFAAASAVAYPGTTLPRAVVTGAPVRPEVEAVEHSPEAVRRARDALGIPAGRRTLAVFGGSLGARRINEAAAGLAGRWRDRDDLTVYHVTGRRDWGSFPSSDGGPDPGLGVPGPGPGQGAGLFVRRIPYEDRMALVYAAADLCVCRAGAMTVAELAATGSPAVLVPLPGAPGDHQGANARVLAQAGAAVVVPDADCDSERLDEVAGRLLGNPDVLGAMRAASLRGRRPGAAGRAADLVESHARPAPRA